MPQVSQKFCLLQNRAALEVGTVFKNHKHWQRINHKRLIYHLHHLHSKNILCLLLTDYTQILIHYSIFLTTKAVNATVWSAAYL